MEAIEHERIEAFDRAFGGLQTQVQRTAPSAVAAPFRFECRILFLAGRWRMPHSRFELHATLLVGSDGHAAGVIDWCPLDGGVPGHNATEWVHGSMNGSRLEVEGYRVDPGLQCDHYRISLSGTDQTGAFDGMSRAWGAWDGRMDGNYEFRTERI